MTRDIKKRLALYARAPIKVRRTTRKKISKMTDKFRNLAHRPAKPALGRGRVRDGAWSGLVFHNGLATTSAVLDEVYDRRPKAPRGFRDRGVYTRLRRRLDEIADRVCRSRGPGRPWLWRLRPGWGPPGRWDAMFDESGEWMRDPDGQVILRDPDLVGVHPDKGIKSEVET